MEIQSNSRAKYMLSYHIIFVTKYKNKVFTGVFETELKKIISETCGVYGWRLTKIGIMPDYLHMVLELPPTIALTDVSKTLKSTSAIYLFTRFPKLKKQKFWGSGLWSKSTFYGTVGEVTEEIVKNYVATQKERGYN